MEEVKTALYNLDLSLSRQIAQTAHNNPSYIRACKIIEWTVHGIPWFIFCALGLLSCNSTRCAQFFVNLTMALIVDLISSGILKVIVRRPRPPYNRGSMLGNAPYVDQFSFPSGHTSRAFTLAALILSSFPKVLGVVSICLSCTVAVSRVMLGRHYLSDVLAGATLGHLQANLVLMLWLSDTNCLAIVEFVQRMSPV